VAGYREVNVMAAHLLLLRDGHVLISRRANTGFADGLWHLPSGHLEARESVTGATIREAAEEIGVAIDPGDLEFAHVMQHRHGDEPVRTPTGLAGDVAHPHLTAGHGSISPVMGAD
jgi:8-oxo-dGTP pyrophosphatase MutT (NUDIX family)